MTKSHGGEDKTWAAVKLIITMVILAGFILIVRAIVSSLTKSIEDGKASLKARGVNISKDGVSVKTDRRPLTQEETQDQIQKGIMKGWKASTFQAPKGLGLEGSSHDVNREEWEKKHGPKKKKA